MEELILLPGEHFESSTKPQGRKRLFDATTEEFKYKVASVGSICHPSSDVTRFSSIGSRYYPAVDDRVVGVIVQKQSDGYILDINTDRKAFLGNFAFVGADKKSRPDLKVGDIVFCRVQENEPYLPVKLTCISTADKKGWATGESLFGRLNGGIEFKVPVFFCLFLLKNEKFFEKLKSKGKIEVVIGVNGMMFVSTRSDRNNFIIQNAFTKMHSMTLDEASDFLLCEMDKMDSV